MHWINEIAGRYHLFESDTEVLNLGCKSGELVEELADTITEGQLWGIELEPSYQEQLESLEEKLENFHLLNDNPLLARTYEEIDRLFDVVINSLDLAPMKKLQADENSMVVLRRGGALIDTFTPTSTSQSKSRQEFLKNKDFGDLSQFVKDSNPAEEVHEQELVVNFLQNLKLEKVKWEEAAGQQLVLAWKEEPDFGPFEG